MQIRYQGATGNVQSHDLFFNLAISYANVCVKEDAPKLCQIKASSWCYTTNVRMICSSCLHCHVAEGKTLVQIIQFILAEFLLAASV